MDVLPALQDAEVRAVRTIGNIGAKKQRKKKRGPFYPQSLHFLRWRMEKGDPVSRRPIKKKEYGIPVDEGINYMQFGKGEEYE